MINITEIDITFDRIYITHYGILILKKKRKEVECFLFL